YVSGTWIDGAWLLGYAFIGVAPLHPSATREPRAQAIHGLGRGRLAFVLGAVLVPVVVLARELHLAGLDGLSTPTVAVAVAAATMLLVAGRLWMLLGRARRFEAARGAERLSALVDHSADAILLLGPDLAVRFASPATAEIWGAPVDTYLGQTFPQMLAGEDRSAFARQLRGLASDTGASSAPIEGWLQPAEGPPRAFEGTARNLLDNPSVDAIVITLRDVTHRRELEAQLERRALHDPLTGLANRTLFTDRVRHALQRAVRQPAAGTAVVFIDLDDFKAVNDGMGHGAGDELLREVGGRLRSCIRPADTVARLGGDEFALLLEDLDTPDQARHLAERALEMLKMPLHVGDLDLAVPASAGIAFATPDCTVDTILRDADLAMYSAKNAGKSQVAMFDDALRDVAARRLALRAALPEALRLDQFRLAYQPIHDVADRHLRGFEALLRWDHPEDGEVSPADFIPDAEESGLIVDIGRWVLHQACLQAAEWNRLAARPLEMSVNVSGVQLRHPAFLTDVAQALANAGLPANHLTLEITESVLIDHGDDMAVLTSLREMGVGLALDDFGTGYSSLAYLQRFPVTSVKIDRAFVSQLSSGGDDALVRSVVAIAEALSLTTVAEGVETDEQLSILDGLECALAQGYHVGRPESAEHITELINRAAVSGG
ncbi:MAG: EAL domain-containing protein, partial [Actinobacteria bacterium]|nr:EAL domain-containing protein [Actinomycetota bacterium]